MSYSFSIRAEDKAEAKNMVAAELLDVVRVQPGHERDVVQAQTTCNAYIDLLEDDATMVYQVNVAGSLSWTGLVHEALTVQGSAISVSVYHATRRLYHPTTEERS